MLWLPLTNLGDEYTVVSVVQGQSLSSGSEERAVEGVKGGENKERRCSLKKDVPDARLQMIKYMP